MTEQTEYLEEFKKACDELVDSLELLKHQILTNKHKYGKELAERLK